MLRFHRHLRYALWVVFLGTLLLPTILNVMFQMYNMDIYDREGAGIEVVNAIDAAVAAGATSENVMDSFKGVVVENKVPTDGTIEVTFSEVEDNITKRRRVTNVIVPPEVEIEKFETAFVTETLHLTARHFQEVECSSDGPADDIPYDGASPYFDVYANTSDSAFGNYKVSRTELFEGPDGALFDDTTSVDYVVQDLAHEYENGKFAFYFLQTKDTAESSFNLNDARNSLNSTKVATGVEKLRVFPVATGSPTDDGGILSARTASLEKYLIERVESIEDEMYYRIEGDVSNEPQTIYLPASEYAHVIPKSTGLEAAIYEYAETSPSHRRELESALAATDELSDDVAVQILRDSLAHPYRLKWVPKVFMRVFPNALLIAPCLSVWLAVLYGIVRSADHRRDLFNHNFGYNADTTYVIGCLLLSLTVLVSATVSIVLGLEDNADGFGFAHLVAFLACFVWLSWMYLKDNPIRSLPFGKIWAPMWTARN